MFPMLVVIVTCIIIGGNKTVVELPILDNVFLSSFKRTRRLYVHSVYVCTRIVQQSPFILSSPRQTCSTMHCWYCETINMCQCA
ncbi:hypothetical protein COCSADRAFT_251577 [Bipolaris sorokiniana ND90Pr]|uniref:Secreted protein n=1 Tax=Cochliobolus sativus (strain ND90Pr / ATCC 201652) TaxID=665912 RepID=M2QX11_COCSN|nr:uncharacterized protein COCSADRAFT_251577 [Bipolaris sorokiniana ND90Pr]EMD59584.1 hypothetical protein COCSADRAFT_251577 [Bipolaris sorokiniana ND90Pr]